MCPLQMAEILVVERFGGVAVWSLKLWIGPCSLSRKGQHRPRSRAGPLAPAGPLRSRAPPCRPGSRSCLPRRSGCSRNRAPDGGRSARSATVPAQLRPVHRDGLQVGTAMQLLLLGAEPRADIADEVLEAGRGGSRPAPGGARSTDPRRRSRRRRPATGRELQPALDERACGRAGQQPIPPRAGPAVGGVIGMRVPVGPREISVKRCRGAQADPAAQGNERVPDPCQLLVECSGWREIPGRRCRARNTPA